jgi:hypothetical protein
VNATEWAREFLGIAADDQLWAQPAAAAQRLAAITGKAAEALPFGAEPPDFLRLLEELAGDE